RQRQSGSWQRRGRGDPRECACGPYQAGPGVQLAGSGIAGQFGPGAAAAYQGVAVGTYIAAPRDAPARLPVSLPSRPAALAGREDLLASLHELLTRGGAPRTVVLSGMGGVGKTSLAAEYAYRRLAEVTVAWQVDCEDPVVAAQGMAELAAQVGGRELADPRDPVASAHAVLAASASEWLLIFDNAADEPSVRQILPPAGAGPGGGVSAEPPRGGGGLDVPVLDVDVAAQFLASRAGAPDQAAAAVLAGELGGLPLALEQAAAYIQATVGTLGGYLGLFRQRRAELLDRGGAAGH